ncbi:hypothetical protein ACH4E8_00065 [Streptomyces sp. NPDC017979]|uniref:hypothetical protein n=1 Tax=Streptomyces sp. NPDC017979 TaxID=3365024 RepID=UPI0037B970BE
MAWEEWDQLKATAADRGNQQMQLNGLPPGEGGGSSGGQGVLRASQTDLAAVGDHAFKLYDRLWPEARTPIARSTGRAADDLVAKSFALGGALRHVAARWDKQLGTLMDACAHISNHMDFTKKTHKDDDEHIKRNMSSIAMLDRGFDESYAPAGKKKT